MPELSTSTAALWLGAAEAALRLFLFVTGVLIAGHYLLMANFMQRAPHFVKAVALPVLTASGVGMVACAFSGALSMGLIFGSLAAGFMVAVNVAAWSAGAYVSEQFDRAAEVRAQIRRDGWVFVRRFDQMTDAARGFDSEPTPLEPQSASQRGRHESS